MDPPRLLLQRHPPWFFVGDSDNVGGYFLIVVRHIDCIGRKKTIYVSIACIGKLVQKFNRGRMVFTLIHGGWAADWIL